MSCMLCHLLSTKLVKNSPKNEDELWFLLNEKLVKFTYRDWCVITRLHDPIYRQEPEIPKSNVTPRISKTFLEGKRNIKSYDFMKKFKRIQNDEFRDEMMVKLANLFFVECVLLGRDKKTNIPRKHMLFADEYDLYVDYPWGRKAFLQLIKDFKNKTNKTFNKVVADEAAQPTLEPSVEYNLHGCPLVLQVKDLAL